MTPHNPIVFSVRQQVLFQIYCLISKNQTDLTKSQKYINVAKKIEHALFYSPAFSLNTYADFSTLENRVFSIISSFTVKNN